MPTNNRQTYTVEEVADILGIGKTLTYKMVRFGEIPAKKCGGRWIVPISRFIQWLNRED